ncbi:MAG TPA: phosphoribosylformylglycinamidine synthase subunit PurQ [Candidatus Obscuribacterales bacterium]
MIKPKAFVLCGDGINCDAETIWALNQAGFVPTRVHTSEILETPRKLMTAQLLALPGGFSFGDEIASGKVLALKLKEKLKDVLYDYIERGSLVLGICNGFQVLTQLGLLPNSKPSAPRTVSLTHNNSGKFINKWVELEISPFSSSTFFEGLTTIHLPVRHGEGRLVLDAEASPQTIEQVKKRAVLRYAEDINGSYDRIAALTNERGNVLGLMPHPEAFVRWSQHPAWTLSKFPTRSEKAGLKVTVSPAFGIPHGLSILMNAAKAVR